MRLERHLIELRVAEGGKGRGSALHVRDEALLTTDDVRDVRVLGLSRKFQRYLRLTPHRIERIVPQEKAFDRLRHTVASESQITRLNRGPEGCPHEIDCGCDRLRPDGDVSHCVVDLGLVGDEAVLLDKVACELHEAITVGVAMEDRAEEVS